MTIDERALYVRDGDAFVGTKSTLGSWYPNGQSGGAVLSLLGHVLEDVPTLTPMSVTRFTVDIVRPVPAGEQLTVEPTIVREGKKVQVVDLTLTSESTEHVRARVLRIRDADLTGLEGMPHSSTASDPAAALPPPEDVEPIDDHSGVAAFLLHGAEFRPVRKSIEGAHGVWTRFRVPVVAGEPIRPTSKVTMPMDLVNLIGAWFDPMRVTAINPDVSAHVFRPPEGEWVALVGSTRFSHQVGHGVSMATLSDTRGVFGLTSTSQLLQPR